MDRGALFRATGAVLCAAALAGLAGCVQTTLAPGAARAPAARVAPPASGAAPVARVSPRSEELRDYYARVEQSLRGQGLLRVDSGLSDAPYSADQLAENFRRIALYEEYTNVSGRLVASQNRSSIHKWDRPVRIGLEFGGEVTAAQRSADRAEIARVASRLARASGHPVVLTGGAANFHVIVADDGARQRLGPRLRQIIPTISDGAARTITSLPRSFYCVVVAYDPDDNGTYSTAVAIIRAELPDLMRRSCIHEEIAQGLGLANDSPAARPSVFNDDEEFALLTPHDEALLRILYNPALRPGMTEAEAMPIVRALAVRLVGGSG